MNPESGRILEYLNNNEYFNTIENKEKFCDKLVYTYKIDIIQELKKMDIWLFVNPKKRYKKYDKFIINWLNNQGR